MSAAAEKRVLQFCHGYDGPFLDCARQYASLFDGTDYRVTTVFLTGKPDPEVAAGCNSDEVIFMDYSSAAIRGLKLKAIRELRDMVRQRHFSFCLAHRSKPTYIACLATRLPIIGIHHAFGDFKRLGRRLFARLFRQRLHLLGVSDAVRDDIRRCLPGWPLERIQTLYNRIDVGAVQGELLERAVAREALQLPADVWIIGNVGRLHPDKDQATLLRAFARALPRLPSGSLLVILGKGRLEQALKAQAVSLGISDQVIFMGQVPQARRYFRAFDTFALSSDHEPFGMVLLEAMAAELPLICSDCGGGPEVLGDAGLLFPLGDDERLAECFQQVAQLDVEQLKELRQLMQARLADMFSDTAARARFWEMPNMIEAHRGK